MEVLWEGQRGSSTYFLGFVSFYLISPWVSLIKYCTVHLWLFQLWILQVFFVGKKIKFFSLWPAWITDLRALHTLRRVRIYCFKKQKIWWYLEKCVIYRKTMAFLLISLSSSQYHKPALWLWTGWSCSADLGKQSLSAFSGCCEGKHTRKSQAE